MVHSPVSPPCRQVFRRTRYRTRWSSISPRDTLGPCLEESVLFLLLHSSSLHNRHLKRGSVCVCVCVREREKLVYSFAPCIMNGLVLTSGSIYIFVHTLCRALNHLNEMLLNCHNSCMQQYVIMHPTLIHTSRHHVWLPGLAILMFKRSPIRIFLVERSR